MAKFSFPRGTLSKLLRIFVQDSSSTVGAGLTGLVFNSAGLTCYYIREGAATPATSVTLGTALVGTYTSGGFIQIDSTNMPGVYEVGIPDAALTYGTAASVLVYLRGATNMAPLPLEIQLDESTVRKNLITNNVEFLMTQLSDHTPTTGTAVTVTRSIDGGAFAAGGLSAVVEVGSGIYRTNFGTSDYNGGIVTLRATAAGCDDTFVTFVTS